MEFLTNNFTLLAGGTTAGLVLWLLKKIPNNKIYDTVENCSFTLGSLLTLRLSKMKWTKDLWNATIEPWFVDLIDNTIGAFVQGFINGLRSDD